MARHSPFFMKDIVRKNQIDILCLYETRISGIKANKVLLKLGFGNWICVEATWFTGGILAFTG